MLRIATIFALIASPAVADSVHTWGSQFYSSTISLEPTEAPGAVAEVVFDNKTVHSDDLVVFVLELDGMAVEVTALVGNGLAPDRMSVVPPVGFIAVPPELDVAEDAVGVILVMPWVGF